MMRASVEAPACAMLLPTMPTYVPSVVCPLISDLRSPSVVSMTARADDQVTLLIGLYSQLPLLTL